MTKRFILFVIAITLYGLQFCIYVQNIDLPEFDYSGGFDVVMAQSTTLGVKGLENGKLSDKNAYYNMLSRYDWDADIAWAVMMAESGGNPNVINWHDYHAACNCYGSFGLFQLAAFRGTRDVLLDAEKNIEMAYNLWQEKGWRPWGAYRNGSYLKFLR